MSTVLVCVYASCHQLSKSINTCKEKKNNNQKQPEEEEQQQNNPKSDYAYQFLRLYIHRWAVETKNDDDRTPKRMERRIHMARKSLNEREREKRHPIIIPKTSGTLVYSIFT
jgi:hypothetical protein